MLIDKDFQNKGYGKQLINKIIDIKPTFIVIECDKKTKEYYIKNFNFFEINMENLIKYDCENIDLCVLHYSKYGFNKKFSYVYKL
jgi:GNAT superfamily N-acetyltransferase